MKIIDYSRKGNVIRFYLGEKTKDWGWTNKDYKDSDGKTPDWLKPSDSYYGDDWDDNPYDCNAGQVYDEFVKGIKDIALKYDVIVEEPCNDNWFNTSYCKDDMVEKKVPCIVILDGKYQKEEDIGYSFSDICKNKNAIKIYLGDNIDDAIKRIENLSYKDN